MDIHKLLLIIKRRKLIFFGAFLVVLFGAIFAPNSEKEVSDFRSTAKVLLTPDSSAPPGVAGYNNKSSVISWFADEATIDELLKSEELLRRVADRVGGNRTWESLMGRFSMTPAGSSNSGYISSNKVNIFYISGIDSSPEEAQRVTGIFVDEFVNYIQDLSAREHANTRRFLEELIAEAQENINTSESELSAMREQFSVNLESAALAGSPIEAQRNQLMQQRLELSREELAYNQDVEKLNNYLDGKSSTIPWEILENKDASLGSLRQAASAEELELVKTRAVFTDNSNKVQLQADKLNKINALLSRELSDQASSLLENQYLSLQKTREQIAAVDSQLNTIAEAQMNPEQQRRFNVLKRKLTMWEDNHLNLTKQHYQARVVEQASRRQGAMSILQHSGYGFAVTSFVPESFLSTALAMLPFSLMFALSLTFLVEYLGTSMKIRPRVEEALELPVIGVIPVLEDQQLAQDWEDVKKGRKAVAPPQSKVLQTVKRERETRETTSV